MTVSVLVVDDSGFFRKRLTEILNASGNIRVVGAASNGKEGVELAEKLRITSRCFHCRHEYLHTLSLEKLFENPLVFSSHFPNCKT